MYTKFLTTGELAARWGRPARTIRHKINLGLIPHIPGFHRPFLIPISWIASFEADQTNCKQPLRRNLPPSVLDPRPNKLSTN